MRLKSLTIIACLSLLSFHLSSCLNNELPDYDYNPDATLKSIVLDSARLGKNYPLTIEQFTGKIYNVDSLPVGADTIIDKILITEVKTAGYMTIRNAADTEDSLFTIKDSIDLRNTMETLPDGRLGEPFRFKIWAQDMEHVKEYALSIRVHQQHADSLNWGTAPMATDFAPKLGDAPKSVIFRDQIWTFSNSVSVYTSSLNDGKNWSGKTLAGLPSQNFTSLICFNDKLFATLSDSEDAYCSTDGTTWEVATGLTKVNLFIATFDDTIAAICTDENGIKHFTYSTDGLNWETAEEVPVRFPQRNISSVAFKNRIGVTDVRLVGELESENVTESDTTTVTWAYMKGQKWVPIETESTLYKCPKVEHPTLLYYDGVHYIFGEDFRTIYRSYDGLTWKPVEKRFMFPVAGNGQEGFRGMPSDYSAVVDSNNYIWLMRSTPNEVWRGRLNVLGFNKR